MTIKNALVLFIIIAILCAAFYFIKDGIIKSNTQVIDFIILIYS